MYVEWLPEGLLLWTWEQVIITFDSWGNRAMATGRAKAKHSVHTAAWIGKWMRGNLCQKDALDKRNR